VHYIKNRVICAIVREFHIEFLFERIDGMFCHLVVKFIHKILSEYSCNGEISNCKIQDNNWNLLGEPFKAPFNRVILLKQEEV
jgi:hypothetical protein